MDSNLFRKEKSFLFLLTYVYKCYILNSRKELIMKKRRCIFIEEKVWKILQELAKKENRSASNFIEYLIEKWENGE
jgi:macrodomain Ter protein organizer (MatP/YcbG family)